jgi:hypothetical protein
VKKVSYNIYVSILAKPDFSGPTGEQPAIIRTIQIDSYTHSIAFFGFFMVVKLSRSRNARRAICHRLVWTS